MATNYKEKAKQARLKVLEMIHKAGTSHIASNFSVIDIAVVLYENLKKEEDWEEIRKQWNKAFPPPMLLGQNQEKVADWWINKCLQVLLSQKKQQREEIVAMIEENHKTELIELENSGNSKLIKAHISRAFEVYKEQLIKNLKGLQ